MTPNKSEACRKEIEMLMEYDMIEPSKSPWACGVVMAKKKGGQLRFYCDFRYLNAVTIKDAYPIPRIDESPSKLGDAKFFTTLDLGSAFWQVPLRKQDREKTGFACELGLFQWKRMPFGLCNATATGVDRRNIRKSSETGETFGRVSTKTTDTDQNEDQIRPGAAANNRATSDHETMSLDLGDLMAKLDQIDKRLKHSEKDRDVIKKELRYNKHEYLDSYFNLRKRQGKSFSRCRTR